VPLWPGMMLVTTTTMISVERHLSGEHQTWQEAEAPAGAGRRVGSVVDWVSGMAAITELVDRLGMIELLDAAVGPIKERDRGFGARGVAGGPGFHAAGWGGFSGWPGSSV
jgi:hypothetical protein